VKVFRTDHRHIEAAGGAWAVTLGTFDGVHRGHAAICHQAVELARAGQLSGALAVSFARHPRAVLTPEHRPRLLTTLEERIPLLAATGLDRLYVLEFDGDLRELPYDRFVREVLRERLGLSHFVLGHDVHFGKGRGGTARTVAELAESEGFRFTQVSSVQHEGKAISSTRIRDEIERGSLDEAVRMLGHPYLVRGRVVHGRGEGRGLGFPTANLALGHPAKLLPPAGVYAAWARRAGEASWRQAVLNLGVAPTFGAGGELRLEVHLLEDSPDLYDMELEVAFGLHIRPEQRFSGPEVLAARIGKDLEEARRFLEHAVPPFHARALDGPLRGQAE
jgi:riboflavin kinase/FMN adenylyltransferase